MSKNITVVKMIEICAQILSISIPNIEIDDKQQTRDSFVSSKYLYSSNIIIFNGNWLRKAHDAEVFLTCLHETRHAYQYYCIQSNSREDQSTIKTWKREFETYSKPSDMNNPANDELYLKQSIEIDAIAFAHLQMKELLSVDVSIPEHIKDSVIIRSKQIQERLKSNG